MHRALQWLIVGVCLSGSVSASTELCEWPRWQQFKAEHIRDGQVLEKRAQELRTTSEGQAYSLFFALVADDRRAFNEILNWTERHLARGDLTAQLPAWLWVESSGGQGHIADNNAASDADLWMSYALLEAGRRWQSHRYSSLGYLLVRRIASAEAHSVEDLGTVLLPGPEGFAGKSGSVRLNPSYLAPPLLDYLAERFPSGHWPALRASSARVLLDSLQPRGAAPDWIRFDNGAWQRTLPDRIGSYDAIRVYLWVGMLADSHPLRQPLLNAMQPMALSLRELPVPERIDTVSGRRQGAGPYGFSAAVLPLMKQLNYSEAVANHRQRVDDAWPVNTGGSKQESERYDGYYNRVLSLFGLGWLEQRFFFEESGQLQAASWAPSCG
ncbi:cellulase [Spongiibacter nanhainus]|uniref:cellulase n=1 Tax=Spongiibacter nanhainus TaxID=2794344 RepID=A0A7T4QZW4_9GAMM|nr:cellulose synthase complex periplasmic endoglucanase BcsZ [Spongiibacter nanhainus]QQD17820.1 cellulase [Spongiibacter nanhainus]